MRGASVMKKKTKHSGKSGRHKSRVGAGKSGKRGKSGKHRIGSRVGKGKSGGQHAICERIGKGQSGTKMSGKVRPHHNKRQNDIAGIREREVDAEVNRMIAEAQLDGAREREKGLKEQVAES